MFYDKIIRSIVIDDLKKRFEGENINVTYIYFKNQARNIQTSSAITRNLIKQLVSTDNFPSDLESLYNASQPATPPSSSYSYKFLKEYRKDFTSVYAVFDAFDECGDENQKDMLALFEHLENSRYKLLISGRPQTRGKLQSQLINTCTLEIQAKLSDLQHYVNKRMLERKIVPNSPIKKRFLELVQNVDGL